jgi:hypothetical protein
MSRMEARNIGGNRSGSVCGFRRVPAGNRRMPDGLQVSIPVWEERTFPAGRAAVARLQIEIFRELSRDVRAGRGRGGGQPRDGEAGGVTEQFGCGVKRLLAGETPESQLVASLAAGEAVSDVSTELVQMTGGSALDRGRSGGGRQHWQSP